MSSDWTIGRRRDGVLKSELVDDCILWSLSNIDVFSEYSTDTKRLTSRLARCQEPDDIKERHKRFSLLISQFLRKDEWLAIKRKFYSYRAVRKHNRKQVNLPESVWCRLEREKEKRGHASLVECIDDLLSQSEDAERML
jgi:macrodomain Ter protein organizer (MatP/YcbG family)